MLLPPLCADDLVEEALRGRHVHQADDLAAAAGLPEDHDVAGIAAEALDVVVHPLQRRHEVGGAGVAGVRVLRAIGRADRACRGCSAGD